MNAQKLNLLGGNPIGKFEISDIQSVAELRTIDTGTTDPNLVVIYPNLEHGSLARVLGYYSKNDGGGGIFVFDSQSVVADDNGLTIAPTNGRGRWIRQTLGEPVNVKWFGAKGDGVNNDTTAIQAALNAGSKRVYAPAGTYKQTAALTIPANTKLYGDGFASTVFTQATAATNNFNIYNVSNVAIEGIGINATSAVAIHAKATTADVEELILRDIYIYSLGAAGIGVYLETSTTKLVYWPILQNVSVKGGEAASWGTKVGYKIGTAGMLICVGCRIFGGRIWRVHHGIQVVKADTVKSFGMAMDDCDGNGLYLEAAGDCDFYAHRFETATFGKYVEFTAAAADNYVAGIPGNATNVLVADAGTRNSYEGSDGSGGLINRVGDGPYNFRAALTCDSTINTVKLAHGGTNADQVNGPAVSDSIARWIFGGTRSGSGPGGSTLTHPFNFPWTFLACYLATATAQSNADRTIIATRMSLIIETSSGVFTEVLINYTHPGATVLTFEPFTRTGDDVNFGCSYNAGGGITLTCTRNLIKLH